MLVDVGILIAGLVGASSWRTESIQVMRVGETVEIGGYSLLMTGVGEVQGPNYVAEQAEFRIERNGALVALLYPEKRFYPVQGTPTTEAAIHTTWLADLYVVIGDPAESGGIATRIYYNPLVPWIWLGALVMMVGGAVSLSDRRHRVGAPERRRASASSGGRPAAQGAGTARSA